MDVAKGGCTHSSPSAYKVMPLKTWTCMDMDMDMTSRVWILVCSLWQVEVLHATSLRLTPSFCRLPFPATAVLPSILELSITHRWLTSRQQMPQDGLLH